MTRYYYPLLSPKQKLNSYSGKELPLIGNIVKKFIESYLNPKVSRVQFESTVLVRTPNKQR